MHSVQTTSSGAIQLQITVNWSDLIIITLIFMNSLWTDKGDNKGYNLDSA